MDYVVCAHKAIDQDDVAAQLKPVVDPSRTTIVVIQNGVGNEEPFRKHFPQNSIITCVVCFLQDISHADLCPNKANCIRLGWAPHKSVPASSSTPNQRICRSVSSRTHNLTALLSSNGSRPSPISSDTVRPASKSSRTCSSNDGRKLCGTWRGTP